MIAVEKLLLCIGLVLFAVFGACVKWINATAKSPSTIRILIFEAITAAFIGGLVYALYAWLHLPEGLAFIAAGLSGYFGTKSIDLLAKNLVKYFKLDDLSPDTEKSIEKVDTDAIKTEVARLQEILDQKEACTKTALPPGDSDETSSLEPN